MIRIVDQHSSKLLRGRMISNADRTKYVICLWAKVDEIKDVHEERIDTVRLEEALIRRSHP